MEPPLTSPNPGAPFDEDDIKPPAPPQRDCAKNGTKGKGHGSGTCTACGRRLSKETTAGKGPNATENKPKRTQTMAAFLSGLARSLNQNETKMRSFSEQDDRNLAKCQAYIPDLIKHLEGMMARLHELDTTTGH